MLSTLPMRMSSAILSSFVRFAHGPMRVATHARSRQAVGRGGSIAEATCSCSHIAARPAPQRLNQDQQDDPQARAVKSHVDRDTSAEIEL